MRRRPLLLVCLLAGLGAADAIKCFEGDVTYCGINADGGAVAPPESKRFVEGMNWACEDKLSNLDPTYIAPNCHGDCARCLFALTRMFRHGGRYAPARARRTEPDCASCRTRALYALSHTQCAVASADAGDTIRGCLNGRIEKYSPSLQTDPPACLACSATADKASCEALQTVDFDDPFDIAHESPYTYVSDIAYVSKARSPNNIATQTCPPEHPACGLQTTLREAKGKECKECYTRFRYTPDIGAIYWRVFQIKKLCIPEAQPQTCPGLHNTGCWCTTSAPFYQGTFKKKSW